MSADIYGEFFGDFSTMMGEDMAFLSRFLIVYLVVWLLSMGYSILVYVLQSLGLYTVANRRGIHHPWMAWLPVVNLWILGSVADQYQYVAKGKVTNRRKVMLGLNIAMYVMLLLILIFAFILGFSAATAGFGGSLVPADMILPAVVVLVLYLALLVVAIVLTVFQYIASYDLYVSCDPNNAVAFLVLSIFFNFLTPYFVFACRKKDKGMPPRKQPAAEQAPVAEPIAAIAEAPVVEEAPVAEEPFVADESAFVDEAHEEPENTEE